MTTETKIHNQKSSNLQSEAVKDFLFAVETAKPDFKWIQDTIVELKQNKRFVRRNVVNVPFGLFETDHYGDVDASYLELIDSGDSWYKTFREKECEMSSKSHGYCYSNKPIDLNPWSELPRDTINTQNSNSQNIKDLYEEAEFEKLSKFEQEESEILEPSDNTPIFDSNGAKSNKVRSTFNPSHEIKLKTSMKMINNKLSAVLPSDLYEREISGYTSSVDLESIGKRADQVVGKQFDQLPNLNVFKRGEEDSVDVLNSEVTTIQDLGEEFKYVDWNELKTEYDEVMKEMGTDEDSVETTTESNESEDLEEPENHALSFNSRKLLSIDEDTTDKETNKQNATNSKSKKKNRFENDPFHLKAYAQDVHTIITTSISNGTKHNQTEVEDDSLHNPNTTNIDQNSTVETLPTPIPNQNQQQRFLRRSTVVDSSYTDEDFISGKAMTEIIEKLYGEIAKDPAKEKLLSRFLPPKQETLAAIKKVAETEMKERKNSHKRDQVMKSLANKIDHLVQEEMMGRSCVRLSPQLQAYYEKLLGAAEHHSATDSGLTRRGDRNRNSFTDQEYNDDDEYEDGDYFTEPLRRKRYAINFDANQLKCRYETLRNFIHKYDQLTIDERQQLRVVHEMLARHLRILDEIREIISKSDQVVEAVAVKTEPVMKSKPVNPVVESGGNAASETKKQKNNLGACNAAKANQQRTEHGFEKTKQFERLEKTVNFIHRNIKD